jgi:uncharacterized Ntn-hydrolase superfamily protein
MTWSIVARDPVGHFGVVVASRFFAVGSLCPYGDGAVGALSTQALVNPLYGPRGLGLLAAGHSATHVVDQLIAADDGRDQRQVHVVDARGSTAAHTGLACVGWCGHSGGDQFSVAGNMLAGPDVIAATVAAYSANRGLPLAERLLAAMDAGEAAGGDKRGKQAAALQIHTSEAYAAIDLRVDDHAEPLVELRRLYRKSLERYQPFVACLPSRANPAGVLERDAIDAAILRFNVERTRNG